MRESYVGIDKKFYCCTKMTDGEDYGFVHTSETEVQAELSALKSLVRGANALATSRVVSTHSTSEYGMTKAQWERHREALANLRASADGDDDRHDQLQQHGPCTQEHPVLRPSLRPCRWRDGPVRRLREL